MTIEFTSAMGEPDDEQNMYEEPSAQSMGSGLLFYPADIARIVSCPQCELQFVNRAALKAHQETEHQTPEG